MKEKDFSKKLNFSKVILPMAIGLLVAGWMLFSNLKNPVFIEATNGTYVWVDGNKNQQVDIADPTDFQLANGMSAEGELRYSKETNGMQIKKTELTLSLVWWLFISLLAVIARDIGYMIRIRILTKKQLSWRQAFDSIMLWEFASAVTPSVVGGSGVAIFILNREGLSVGKSTAVVMVTALLDELFYILMVPLLLIFIGTSQLFPVDLQKEIFGIELNTQGLFWAGYGFIVLLTLSISLAIFLFPRALKYLLLQIFRMPILRRWRYKVIQVGDDIITTSKEIKGEKAGYWLKAFLATFLSWTARYWVVNFLILGFGPVSNHVLLYARQLVMWVIMLISPTPGGAGVAELAFDGFLKDFTPIGFAVALALVWRIFTYYPYLFVGAFILPRWLKKTRKASH